MEDIKVEPAEMIDETQRWEALRSEIRKDVLTLLELEQQEAKLVQLQHTYQLDDVWKAYMRERGNLGGLPSKPATMKHIDRSRRKRKRQENGEENAPIVGAPLPPPPLPPPPPPIPQLSEPPEVPFVTYKCARTSTFFVLKDATLVDAYGPIREGLTVEFKDSKRPLNFSLPQFQDKNLGPSCRFDAFKRPLLGMLNAGVSGVILGHVSDTGVPNGNVTCSMRDFDLFSICMSEFCLRTSPVIPSALVRLTMIPVRAAKEGNTVGHVVVVRVTPDGIPRFLGGQFFVRYHAATHALSPESTVTFIQQMKPPSLFGRMLAWVTRKR